MRQVIGKKLHEKGKGKKYFMLVGKLKAKRVRKISKIGVPEGVKISVSQWGFYTFLNDTVPI
jgi:hypothetical protein